MTLINCQECGERVSDKAAACPSCGAPVTTQEAGPGAPRPAKDDVNNQASLIAVLIVGLIIVVAIVIGNWKENVQEAASDYMRANSQSESEGIQGYAGEFVTISSCLSAVRGRAGEPLEIIIDEPNQVTGYVPDGRFFDCERRETHTKGTYIQGYIAAE